MSEFEMRTLINEFEKIIVDKQSKIENQEYTIKYLKEENAHLIEMLNPKKEVKQNE